MAYATEEYYKNTYKGKPLTNPKQALDRSSDDMDTMCYGRIRGREFDKLTEYQQECIRKATCAHAEFNEQYGAFLEIPMNGYSVGKTSMSFDVKQLNGIYTSLVVINLLDRTGLTCLVL